MRGGERGVNSITNGVSAVSVAREYVTEQLDADTAFLNSDLKEQVFMEVLAGIPDANKVMCKLDNAIYGLKLRVHVPKRFMLCFCG